MMIFNTELPASKNIEMVQNKSSEFNLGSFIWKGLNTLNHCLIFTVSFYISWLAFTSDPFRLFELHVAFSTLGYQLLMAQSILSLCGDNSWTSMLSRSNRRLLHAALGCLGSILAIAGTAIIIHTRIQAGKTHFKNPHAITGLVALVLLVPTAINGPVTLYQHYSNRLSRPVYMRCYHALTAGSAFCLALTSLCLGYQKKWFRNKTSPEFVTCFIVFTSLTMVLTMKTPLYNMYKLILGRCQRYSQY